MLASVFVGASVDGFIARVDGGLDWLPGDDCEAHGYEEFMDTVDALVMGRNTFDIVLGFGEWPFSKPVFVLTSRPLTSVPPGAVLEAMAGDPAEIVSGCFQGLAQRRYIHPRADVEVGLVVVAEVLEGLAPRPGGQVQIAGFGVQGRGPRAGRGSAAHADCPAPLAPGPRLPGSR